MSRPDFALDVDLRLPINGITVIFGPSGSGKTTILRCVAGLEVARKARIVVAGEVWQDDRAGIFLPTHSRTVGYVFQEASLFDHLDVQGNLQFGRKRTCSAEATSTLDAAIELLGIGHLLGRRVDQLSGGERQRVAIARALATMPRLLLLDEPMAALDAARRQEIMPWLEKLRTELSLPMLYVTHSVDELVRLADYLVVLKNGQVKSAGPTEAMLSGIDIPVVPDDDVGALLHGVVVECSAAWHLVRVEFDRGSIWISDDGIPVGNSVRVRVLARDVSLSVCKPALTSIQNQFPGVVESIASGNHPSQVFLRIRCGTAVLVARVTRRAMAVLRLEVGSAVWAQVKSAALAH